MRPWPWEEGVNDFLMTLRLRSTLKHDEGERESKVTVVNYGRAHMSIIYISSMSLLAVIKSPIRCPVITR